MAMIAAATIDQKSTRTAEWSGHRYNCAEFFPYIERCYFGRGGAIGHQRQAAGNRTNDTALHRH